MTRKTIQSELRNADKIRVRRIELGYTQSEVTAILNSYGLNWIPKTYGTLESGARYFRVTEIPFLAKALSMSVSDFYRDSDEITPSDIHHRVMEKHETGRMVRAMLSAAA